jgi:hypothetical protein
MEEFFLHRWDDLDDITHACRHLAAGAAYELVGAAVPLIVTAAAALIGGAATLLLSHGPSGTTFA